LVIKFDEEGQQEKVRKPSNGSREEEKQMA
jgi:hypothetical protein